MTNLRNVIKKHKIYPFEQNGETMLKVAGKPSPADIKIIKNNKQAIIAECVKMMEEREERMKAEREEKRNGNIEIVWHDGEYLSGYRALGNAELLVELGLGKEVENWGVLVGDEIAEALGAEVTADQAKALAVEKLKKSAAEKEIENKAEEERIEAAIETAKVLGHKVEIARHVVDCDGSVSECSTDILIEYIDGKGEYSEERVHTH